MQKKPKKKHDACYFYIRLKRDRDDIFGNVMHKTRRETGKSNFVKNKLIITNDLCKDRRLCTLVSLDQVASVSHHLTPKTRLHFGN